MILSIITINRNNCSGLQKTLASVLSQNISDFEYIVVDGASTDGSVEVIKEYAREFGNKLQWVSEIDSGIYNAMNKGISMASGDYIQFLNSGDFLASNCVERRMMKAIETAGNPSILYGNLIKSYPDGRTFKDQGFAGKEISLSWMYSGALNHSSSLIMRSLFEKYGNYNESFKIVSDWEWFLKVIILGEEKPQYTDIDVTVFDMTGISETNKELEKAERQKVLSELIPAPILSDYDQYSFAIGQFKRLQRHPWAYKIVWFIERILFKFEKR